MGQIGLTLQLSVNVTRYMGQICLTLQLSVNVTRYMGQIGLTLQLSVNVTVYGSDRFDLTIVCQRHSIWVR
jgi:hypothetical protein